jgi:hypothetical protein
LALAGGCTRRERPEAALARSRDVHLREQIAGLEKTIGQVERGEVTTTDQVAIGLSEDLAKGLLNASLPLETVVASRLRVTVDSAEPFFRGTKAAILFRATVASVDLSSASASVEIGGGLEEFELARGRLRARVALTHFNVRESGLGDLAADAIDGLIRARLAAIEDVIPPLEIPVELEESMAIGGLAEGPVVAKAGLLPLEVAVTQVIVGNRRLWVLLKARAGPWQPAASRAETSEKAR